MISQREDSLDSNNSGSTVYSIQGRLDRERALLPGRMIRTEDSTSSDPYVRYASPRLPTMPEEMTLSCSVEEQPHCALHPQHQVLMHSTYGERSAPAGAPQQSTSNEVQTMFDHNSSINRLHQMRLLMKSEQAAASSSQDITASSASERRNLYQKQMMARTGLMHRTGKSGVAHYMSSGALGATDNNSEGEEGDFEMSFDDDPNTVIGSEEEDEFVGIHSPLVDQATLRGLTKAQVIALWRTSEMDLRRQLSQAIKENKDISSRLEHVDQHTKSKPP